MWIELKSECTQNTVYHIIISHMLYISQYLWYLTHSQLLQLNVYGHLVTNISQNTHLVYLICVQNWTSWKIFEILKPWFIALWVVSSQVWIKRNVTQSQRLHLLSAYWNLIVDYFNDAKKNISWKSILVFVDVRLSVRPCSMLTPPHIEKNKLFLNEY